MNEYELSPFLNDVGIRKSEPFSISGSGGTKEDCFHGQILATARNYGW